MALVITLILLSVTLIMALAFLAISTRERTAITTSTETATARLAADSALAAAEAQIAANILSTTNPYNYGLLVSTNFVPPPFFPADPLSDLTNLFFSPRPPVVITDPKTGVADFRFYLDLNRNGTFDTNGLITNVDSAGNILLDSATNPIVTFQVGDPEWIGVLEHPDAPHGPNNKFLSRYLFYCQPIGNALDLNQIYNQAITRTVNPNSASSVSDGFFRNQGVGSWEINLAALLADLNTNQWDTIAPYNYLQPEFANAGLSFQDALSLLSYRYGYNYNTLATVQNLYGVNGSTAFLNDNIDGYSDGAPMTNLQLSAENDLPNTPWAGSDNTNHFFNLSAELFDPAKSSLGFTNRLGNAGAGVSTYDRYTFYRLLDQIGADSTPESGKMNLNYDNLTPNANGVASATNFFAWTPIGFYTNAADRMLRLYTANWLASDTNSFISTFGVTNAFGVANIPVLVDGRMVYSPAVQRILQLAANMYDAVYYTNNYFPISGSTSTPYLPSVFQPIFSVQGGTNVYITSFVEATDTSVLSNKLLNLNAGPLVIATLASEPGDLVFGVPLIIGAKKGFPNFNQFAMQSAFGLGRKLQVTRTSINANPNTYKINQMFHLTLTNQLGVECWNSYGSDYTRPVIISANDYLSLTLTNDEGFSDNFGGTFTFGGSTNLNVWPASSASASFQIPLTKNIAYIPPSIYHFNPPGLIPTNANPPYETNVVINGSSYPQPAWGLLVTNNLQVAIVDSGRIIDYVQLSGPNVTMNLNTAVNNPGNPKGYDFMWVTNVNNGVPVGIANQINVSRNSPKYIDDTSHWNQQDPITVENEIDAFLAYYGNSPYYKNPSGAALIAAAKSSLAWQVPYTASTNFSQYITWQANDPLVHYLASDLNDTKRYEGIQDPLINTSVVNERYQPWGAKMLFLLDSDTNTYNLQFKDPRVYSSDYWDFPTNKFPTVGWLSRVHRGTPWQTVYLKAHNILTEQDPSIMHYTDYGTNTWVNWTGDTNTFDAVNSAPLQDRYLFDLFTTAPNDNATRGQLPVNQKNFAAWSALFSGMIVPTNLFGGYTVINPGGALGTGSAVFQMFNDITNMGALYTNTTSSGGAFKHIGDVLSAVTLTEQSPFLNWSAAQSDPNGGNINDEMYEWLPQQMMSLLRISTVPRYVIYSHGQTLAPAGANAVITGGSFSGMVTNYQVVAETVMRTVVRIEGAPTNTHAVVESFNIMPPQ